MHVTITMDDSPKLRFVLAIIAAHMMWLVFLFAFGQWLRANTFRAQPAKPLQMQLVELAPLPPTRADPAPTRVVKQSHSVEPRVQTVPKRTEKPALKVPVQTTHAIQNTAPIAKEPGATTPSASAAAETQSASQPATTPSETAARSIAQPLPELPDDLREQAYQTVATARFVIHADGSVDVELIRLTPNPRLNQLLLQALRQWRFSPALRNGHPVESQQDVRVHFNVN